MMNYFADIADDGGVRQHPWGTSLADENCRYYDFKAEPHLIRKVLEDFKAWEGHSAINEFYNLVEWINGPGANLESNDCRLRGPKRNQQRDLCDKDLLFSGGLMVLFRNLELGLSADGPEWVSRQFTAPGPPYFTPNQYIDWIGERSLELIKANHPGYNQACIAVHFYPTFFKHAPVRYEMRFGYQVAFEFWAWGDSESEALDSFGVVVSALSETLRKISNEITE
jgi:hypothetical protein